MARIAMVTRTVSFTRCNIMALDTTKGEVMTVTVDYTGNNKDDDKILKDIKKVWENTEVALVKIVNKEEHEQLYGMTEEQFIKLATPMDSRTQKI